MQALDDRVDKRGNLILKLGQYYVKSKQKYKRNQDIGHLILFVYPAISYC